MTTKTSTETTREVTKKGDVVIVKEIERTTTYVPGKEPTTKEVTRVEEFKGEEGYSRLPEDVRNLLGLPGGSSASANPTATRGSFAENCLTEHNKYRALHGVKPLKLSKQLVQISKKRAEELAEKDEMSSRTDQTYGENLSCVSSNDPEHTVEATELVSRWYSEEKNYNYNEEPQDLNAGRFTQMIWKSTEEFGIAAVKSKSNKIYIVATYSPPGNYVGEFKNNVLPSSSKSKSKIINAKAAESGTTSSKTSSSALGVTKNLSELNDECVSCHNNFRQKHGVLPLSFSKELADYAQNWANELAKQDKIEHRRENKYGENLYSYKNTDPRVVVSASEACRNWYNEIQVHDFDSEPKSLKSGHFTQMIWKSTKEVGMGSAKSKSGLQIFVANYNPPGNVVGKFRENVPKPVN